MKHLIILAVLSFMIGPAASGNIKDNIPDDGTLEELMKFLETEVSLIPSMFYPMLGLDSTNYSEGFNQYWIALKADSECRKTLIIYKQGNCTPVVCMLGVRVYTIENDEINGSEEFEMVYESRPVYSFEHDMFLVISDKVHDWEESESGAMEVTSEAYEVNHYFVLFEDTISGIDDFTKEELRIIRNHIFARYGHKFKSPDLQEYFSMREWYAPLYDNVVDSLTDTDKKIVARIRELETR
ncbi:YARHG domain-containing protein [Bacteroidota bacterium]